MRNGFLARTKDSIPYIKGLRPYAGSITGCILMQQLDYWFNKHPDGFYKFLEPCDSAFYQDGDSWTEEIGISKDEFRTSFDRIGIRYGSKKQFDEAPERFKRLAKNEEGDEYLQEVYYCSYHDKFKGLTFYFRNHNRVDQVLDEVVKAQPQRPTEVGKSNLRKSGKPTYVNRESQPTEVGKSNPDITETTSETTTERGNQIPTLTNPSSAIEDFTAEYGVIPNLHNQERIEVEVSTDARPLWRAVLKRLHSNGTPAKNVGTMLDALVDELKKPKRPSPKPTSTAIPVIRASQIDELMRNQGH